MSICILQNFTSLGFFVVVCFFAFLLLCLFPFGSETLFKGDVLLPTCPVPALKFWKVWAEVCLALSLLI